MCSTDPTGFRLGQACLAGLLAWLCLSCSALGADINDRDENGAGSRLPNVYFDLRNTFAAVPAGVLSVGFRSFSGLSVSSAASKVLISDFPMTIDVVDSLSVYGGLTTSTSRTDTTPWRPVTLDSWNVGFQADIYQQNGGRFPTVTIQSTLTRTIPESLLSATSTSTIAELGYAFDEDETKGVLAGAQYSNTSFDSSLPKVQPAVIGYLGGYYQWENYWKVTARAGIQSFGGAQLLNIAPIQQFTQPIVRFDLEKLDESSNRIFGVTAEFAWTPKLAFQLIVRTPLYLVKN